MKIFIPLEKGKLPENICAEEKDSISVRILYNHSIVMKGQPR